MSHAYGGTTVLRDIDLAVDEGEIVCVLGPSGSGKSTLLKLAAGLEDLQAGTIDVAGVAVSPENCPPPERRPIGLVFQEHALFPHLTVSQNLAFGLTALSKPEQQTRIDALLTQTALDGFADRYPHTLSGGQQQRVALARALAPSPKLMLMDEPFASVDVLLKTRLRLETRLLLKRAGTTVLLVTHDPADALIMADRVAVIVDGRVVQFATPATLWREPAHPFIAEVFADRQMLAATVTDTGIETVFGTLAASVDEPVGTAVRLAVDPVDIAVTGSAEGQCQVLDVRFVGRHFAILLGIGEQQLTALSLQAPAVKAGDRVSVTFASDRPPLYYRA